MLTLILLVFGFVLLVLAGFGIPNPPRFNLMAFGLACIALAAIVNFGPGLLH